MSQGRAALSSCWRFAFSAAACLKVVHLPEALQQCLSRRSLVSGPHAHLQNPVSTRLATAGYSTSNNGVIRHSVPAADGQIEFEVGRLAALADGSCLVRHGSMYVLATVVCNWSTAPVDDFLPLQVDYREGAYASGRIPQTPSRREGGLSERDVLAARAVDRALRPLFPPGFLHETHITALVLSTEPGMEADVAAINAASAALMVSDIPWGGPVGAVRIARVGGQLVVHPSKSQLGQADMTMTYAGTETCTVMLEFSGDQVSEDVLADAMTLGQVHAAEIAAGQRRLAQLRGGSKRAAQLLGPDPALMPAVAAVAGPLLRAALTGGDCGKAGRAAGIERAKAEAEERLRADGVVWDEAVAGCLTPSQLLVALDGVLSAEMRGMVLGGGPRPDGRQLQEIRALSGEVGVLPSGVHGSALFSRGETQSLCTATVGSERDALQGSTVRDAKRFMLHYSFPPLSTGEAGKLAGVPSRRELGHGALAEKALAPVMPKQDDFPFTVRATAETLMSNGSSSMDAGVPLLAPVAGISVGLLTAKPPQILAHNLPRTPKAEPYPWPESYGDYALITDIQGMEDHLGDMDFKVAGTRQGVTAIQLDTKLPGVPLEWLHEALITARTARNQVLDVMDAALLEKSVAAEDDPHFSTIEINKELLKRLIGINGSTLLGMEEATGSKLIVHETGEVDVYAPTMRQYRLADLAVQELQGATIRDGQVYRVKVVKVEDSGAYVQLPNELQAFLHVAEVRHERLRDIREVISEGMEFDVKCIGRDVKGMVKLSKKALEPEPPKPSRHPPRDAHARTEDGQEASHGRGPTMGGQAEATSSGETQAGAVRGAGTRESGEGRGAGSSGEQQQPPASTGKAGTAGGGGGGAAVQKATGGEAVGIAPYLQSNAGKVGTASGGGATAAVSGRTTGSGGTEVAPYLQADTKDSVQHAGSRPSPRQAPMRSGVAKGAPSRQAQQQQHHRPPAERKKGLESGALLPPPPKHLENGVNGAESGS